MRYIRINTLPKTLFAHFFGAEKYEKILPVRKNRIEISYISEGHMITNNISKGKYTVSFSLFDKETHNSSSSFHEHRTACFGLEYEVFDTKEDGAIPAPEHLFLSEYGRCHELIDKIIQIYTISPENELLLSALFLELIAEYSNQCERPRELKSSVYADRAKEYVFSHLHEPITQKEVADALHITPEYLCAVFKKATGISFIKFVNLTKLSKIKELTKRENLRLYEAAEIYGYNDPNYVSRLRKKYDV